MKTVKFIGAATVTFLLAIILLPLGYIIGQTVKSCKKQGCSYCFNVLKGIDEGSNATLAPLFNAILLKFWRKDRYKFGIPEETISSVLGKNYETKTLSWLGLFISWLLDKVQKNHVIKSIQTVINLN